MAEELKYKRKNPFVILPHNFIKWEMLNWNEKDIYIILLMYADSEQKCFPSINTLCRVSGKSNKTVIKALKGLEEKHLLKKENRITKNGKSSNLYILYDFESVWEAENIEQISEIVNIETKRKQLYELARELNYIVTKEKEPEALQADQSNNDSSTHINNTNQFDTTTNSEKSQDLERYTLDQIKQLFDYNNMLIDHSDRQHDIDTVMSVLYTAMNTGKSTIRISGEDKPAMVVIAKLMKLDEKSIMYALDKFLEQSERIKNPTAYLLTILYNAPEQYYLDKKNQERNKMTKEDHNPKEKTNIENKDSKTTFANFKQRTYDYDSLEKELLNRQNF